MKPGQREAFQAAIQSAQAAGYSDWLAADEAAADYIATRIAPKFGVSAETELPQRRLKKIAQGCSHNERATLGQHPTK